MGNVSSKGLETDPCRSAGLHNSGGAVMIYVKTEHLAIVQFTSYANSPCGAVE